MTATSPVSGRISEITSSYRQASTFLGGARSFAATLAGASGGGPRLDLSSSGTSAPTVAVGPQRQTAGSRPLARTYDPSSLPPAAGSGWEQLLPERAQPWIGAIEDAAAANGVDPRLLASLVWTESGFRADAVSPVGARGLAQLMPGTAAGLGVDPSDPIQNLEGGARYLAGQLSTFGRVDLALAAYNAGPGRVRQSGGVPNIAETQAYVRIVTDRYERLLGANP